METEVNYVSGPAADAAGNGFPITFGWFTFRGALVVVGGGAPRLARTVACALALAAELN